ncbi:IS110 family transposase [Wolbachia endosymbiont of Armadillidium arcangelii]|uniref:IS110 family transposase n=1 Tax=Wolbachia endosymbiont of Armadillidium arcangelii TaxID=3158571 RepID=A0AAU7Q136_9RICK
MVISYQNFIGIDIGKLEFVIAVNEQKSVIKFDNSCSGWKQFYQKFSNILPNSMIILEATGGYELGLLYFLIDRNIAVHRANTRQVKNFILSHGTLAKTDNLDAKALAQYGVERCGRLQLFTPISKEQTTLFTLCQRRDDITKMLVQEKNRLKTPGNDYIKESCQQTIEFLNNQVEKLDQAIQKIVNENPELNRYQKILETVPGIGRKTSQCLLCLIPELGSLNKRQVASLAGVAPHPKESGKAIGYRRIIGGRSNVRSKLFTAAMAARNSKSELAAFYCKLIDSGKRKMVALTALMRKIIVIANARLKEAINLHV